MASVLVVTELNAGQPSPLTLELISKARELGDEVGAVVLDPEADSALAALSDHGATTAYVCRRPEFRDQVAQPAAFVLSALVARMKPDLVLFGGTQDGRDIAARLSARLGLALVANALDVLRHGDQYSVLSSVFGATQNVTTQLMAPSPLVLVRPKSFVASPAPGASATVEELPFPEDAPRGARRRESVVAPSAGPKLEDAKVVVSGGRGMQDPANFDLLRRLAELLGGAVGASRAVVDAGWVPYALQVGQTGRTVKPDVYLACGISGAMQHLVGMKGASHIVAVNKDPDAPIFKISDLGVVGDVLKVMPALIAELERRGAGQA